MGHTGDGREQLAAVDIAWIRLEADLTECCLHAGRMFAADSYLQLVDPGQSWLHAHHGAGLRAVVRQLQLLAELQRAGHHAPQRSVRLHRHRQRSVRPPHRRAQTRYRLQCPIVFLN